MRSSLELPARCCESAATGQTGYDFGFAIRAGDAASRGLGSARGVDQRFFALRTIRLRFLT